MTEQKINKSDYTDRKGVVHQSIGENIRSDNNQLSVDYLNSMSEEERASFPFLPFSNGEWVNITDTITGGQHSADLMMVAGDDGYLVLDSRVKFAIITSNNLDQDKSFCYYPTPRLFRETMGFIIRFISPVTTSDNGKTITLMCYVEN